MSSLKMTFSLTSLILIFALTFSVAFVDEAHANADFEGKTIADQVFTEDIAITPITLPTAKNADSYTLSPPTGMDFDAATRVLSGTPTTEAVRTLFTYTAVDDDANNASIIFSIVVKGNQAPKFATGAKIDNQVFKIGKDVEGLVSFPAATDPDAGDVLTYTLTAASGNLPPGVQFDPFQRRLIGRPTTENLTADTLTYTVADLDTDRGGDPVTLTFDVTVEMDHKPDFGTETIGDMTLKVDEAIEDMILPAATDANAGDVAKLMYTLSPSLPTGLEYIESARLLRGTPTAVKAETTHTYTVTDPDGNTDELMFKITVRADPMFADSASIRDYTFVVGTEVDAGPFPTATDDDDDIDAYSLSPQPPDGVTFVASLRKLLGNPTMEQDETEYTYTVTDEAGGTDELTFNITVNTEGDGNGETPPGGDTTPPTVTDNAPTAPITGETVVKLTFSEALSAAPGVMGNPTMELAKYMVMVEAVTGEDAYNVTITPTPEADLTADVPETVVTFTVTGMDAAGNAIADNTTFDVTLAARTAPSQEVDPKPTFPSDATIGDRVYWEDEEGILIRLPEARDDKPTDIETHSDRYSIDPALPDGLGRTFIGSNAYIAGTPTTAQTKTAYKWIYTDAAGGTAEVAFSIAVLARVAPGKVMNLTAEQNSHAPDAESVDLEWDALAVRTKDDADNTGNDGGSPVTHYMISWTGAGSGTMSTADEDDPDALMYTLMQDLSIGEYKFKVAAVNTNGTGAYSDEVTVDIANPPGAPRDLDAALEQVSNRVTLEWLAPRSDGGDAITGYAVYILAPGSQAPKRYATNSTGTSYRTDTLAVEGRYSFRVAAINGCGEGERSNTDTADVDILVNKPPVFQPGAVISNIVATVGTQISVPLPSATDPEGERVYYGVSPALPAGLRVTLVGTSPAIVGTPTAASVQTLYSFIAADFSPVSEDDTISTLPFYITVNPLVPAIVLPHGIPDVGGSFTAGTGRVVGVTTLSGSIAADSFGVVRADNLPNLEEFFRRTGTIVLSDGTSPATEGLGTRAVLISEILWGLDHGEPAGSQDRRQFIELYNTSKSGSAALDVTGWTLTFTLHRTAPANVVDRVSNTGLSVDPGWVMDIGQSGVLTGTYLAGTSALGGQGVPVDIISAYRNINYGGVQGGDLKADHVRWGHQKGSWKASTRITTQVGIKASPGARHFTVQGPLTKTNVPFSPFVINEFGNATGGASDWIEIRNVTDSVQSLKNYQLSVVTADKKDTALFTFHDQDYKVPAKGVILITHTDPSANDLAGGNNAAKGDLDEVLEGATHLYVVPTKGPNGGKFDIPDEGKILLILRNNHEGKHLGTGNQIVDVVGTLSIQDVSRGTNLWPLYVWPGAHGDVNNDDGGHGHEDFRAGYVYQRNRADRVRDEHTVDVRGYTGIGYDRHADTSLENGGTPGYDNGALKHKYSDFSGQISVSEIMLVTEEEGMAGRVPRATRLPQWIELYNNSMTQAVTISNWHLEIQNDDTEGFLGNLHGTLRLPGIVIQPNQTVLIVSASGLNSGNFPPQRTVNVFLNGTWRRELGLVNRGDVILNPAGFYVEIRDHENRHVDEIGNLGVSRRTGTGRRDNFGSEWEIPSLHSVDGHRTSLIRVYNSGSAENGLMEDSWRRAEDTSFRNVPSLTYYGNHRDFGTPGYRGGGPLPVSLSKFRPARLESGEVVIRWITQSELNNAGFNILRSDTRDGEYTKVNTQLIKGHGTTSERHAYEWKDTSAKPNVVYYYQIQDVSIDGQVQTLRTSRLKGHISPAGKTTTTWGELKALQ